METIRIVSISFHTAGKIFDFDARDFDLKPGDLVVVETERGRALGTVIRDVREIPPDQAPPKLKAVQKLADQSDLAMANNNEAKEAEALKFCQARVMERNMEMKLVRAEYLYDGSKIIFYFTADGRVDFRELVRDLAQHFRTRIEMRQIGVRDEAKMVGGLGVCGRELCCSSHLRSFAPVSVKMAKAQGLALNPSKISGQCGRLLCCLAYEYETYNELRKNLPKTGKKIQLDCGSAEVIALDVLGQKMTVCCADGERRLITAEELKKGFDKPADDKAQSAEQKTEQKQQTGRRQERQQSEDDSKKNDEQRNRRRPGNRNRRQKKSSGQPDKQTQQEQRPQQDSQKQQPDKPGGQPKNAAPDQDKSQKRRRKRRPRRRTNKPGQQGQQGQPNKPDGGS